MSDIDVGSGVSRVVVVCLSEDLVAKLDWLRSADLTRSRDEMIRLMIEHEAAGAGYYENMPPASVQLCIDCYDNLVPIAADDVPFTFDDPGRPKVRKR